VPTAVHDVRLWVLDDRLLTEERVPQAGEGMVFSRIQSDNLGPVKLSPIWGPPRVQASWARMCLEHVRGEMSSVLCFLGYFSVLEKAADPLGELVDSPPAERTFLSGKLFSLCKSRFRFATGCSFFSSFGVSPLC